MHIIFDQILKIYIYYLISTNKYPSIFLVDLWHPCGACLPCPGHAWPRGSPSFSKAWKSTANQVPYPSSSKRHSACRVSGSQPWSCVMYSYLYIYIYIYTYIYIYLSVNLVWKAWVFTLHSSSSHPWYFGSSALTQNSRSLILFPHPWPTLVSGVA